MNRSELVAAIRAKKSVLCVGLDTDPSKIPAQLRDQPDGVLRFNKAIIDATKEYAVSYKINRALPVGKFCRKRWPTSRTTSLQSRTPSVAISATLPINMRRRFLTSIRLIP
jgi:hypothetical protein